MLYTIWYTEWLKGEEVNSDWYRDENTDELIVFAEQSDAEKEASKISSEFVSTVVIEQGEKSHG